MARHHMPPPCVDAWVVSGATVTSDGGGAGGGVGGFAVGHGGGLATHGGGSSFSGRMLRGGAFQRRRSKATAADTPLTTR